MNIYSYTDYREYVLDWVELYRKKNKLTNREFGRRLGVKSPSYFSDVIVKKVKNPSDQVVDKMARLLQLNARESEYFLLMIRLRRAGSTIERTDILERMAKYWRQGVSEVHVLDRNEMNYMTEWHCVVLRELIPILTDFGNRNTGERLEIIRKLRPDITEVQIDEAVAMLETMQFIKKDTQGNYIRTEQVIRGERPFLAVHTLRKLIEIGNRIIAATQPEYRQFKTMVLPVDAASYPLLCKCVDRFCQEMLDVVAAGKEKPDRLYNMNLQLYPLTRFDEKKQDRSLV